MSLFYVTFKDFLFLYHQDKTAHKDLFPSIKWFYTAWIRLYERKPCQALGKI